MTQAELKELNFRGMAQVMKQHGFRVNELSAWRPTQPSRGYAVGIGLAGVVVATDGLLAAVVCLNGSIAFVHNTNWSEKIKNLYTTSERKYKAKPEVAKRPRQKKANPRQKKATKQQKLLNLL